MATEPKFTPGPWRITRKQPNVVVNDGGDKWIAKALIGTTQSPRFLRDRDTAEANAHLIAAAPAMYEALEPDWADALWRFLLSEYAANPASSEAVTADVRPHFEALCEFMAARATALSLARGEGK